jgi:hypothetical protein
MVLTVKMVTVPGFFLTSDYAALSERIKTTISKILGVALL